MIQNFSRGILPDLLASQVQNTMPYLFSTETQGTQFEKFEPARILREYHRSKPRLLSHFEYFRLCLCSHYLTCATPVPTDVDNQIRLKLWPAELPLEVALQMARLVLESRKWDFRLVSARSIQVQFEGTLKSEVLSGHLGEWFTVACAAYCALRRYLDPQAQQQAHEIFEEIRDEVHRHSEIFGYLWRSKQGLGCLKASASIAHNFGDLDRVMDLWGLDIADRLRLEYYRLAVNPLSPDLKLRYLGRLWVAGELYKSPMVESSMALENHRHFALRKPKCLRGSVAYLIPIGPFFDDWGRQIACEFKDSELGLEIVMALKSGWLKLPRTQAYGRALRGFLEMDPKLDLVLGRDLFLRSALKDSQEFFENGWSRKALEELEEIPSRA